MVLPSVDFLKEIVWLKLYKRVTGFATMQLGDLFFITIQIASGGLQLKSRMFLRQAKKKPRPGLTGTGLTI
jgi:hypothetical protein